MIRVDLAHPSDFDGWREAARRLLGARAAPEDIVWQVKGEAEDLFAAPADVLPDIEGGAAPRVTRCRHYSSAQRAGQTPSTSRGDCSRFRIGRSHTLVK